MREELKPFKKLQELLTTKYSFDEIKEYINKEGYLILQSDDVDLRELEMHKIVDEDDLLEDFMVELTSRGWDSTNSGYMVKSGCKSIKLDSVYFVSGEVEGYMFSNGMYIDLDTGEQVRDVARSILIDEFDSKYDYFCVDADLLFCDLDIIENILYVETNEEFGCKDYYCGLGNSWDNYSNVLKNNINFREEFPSILSKTYRKVSLSPEVLDSIRDSIVSTISIYGGYSGIIGVSVDSVNYFGFGEYALWEICSCSDIFRDELSDVNYFYILFDERKIKGNCWKYKNLAVIS